MMRVTFSDSPLRWVSALPIWPSGVHYDGQVFDFAGHRAAIERDLTRQITEGLFQPSVLREHMPTGMSHGQVMAWRILSQADAAAMGIPQKAPDELYFGLDLRDPEMAAEYDAGLLTFTSPELRGTMISGEPWTDETGAQWDFFVAELSAVATPHNKRQTAAPHLRGVIMGDLKKAKMADGTIIEIEPSEALPEGATMMEDIEIESGEAPPAWAQALMAQLIDLKARVESMPAPMADGAVATPAVVTAPVPVEPAAPVQMRDAMRRLAALEQKAVAEEVDRLIGERDFRSLTRDKLLAIRMSDPSTFRSLVEMAPRRSGSGSRSAASGVAMSDEQRLFSAEGVAQLRARHTQNGKFDALGYHREWREIRSRVTLSPTGGAA
ncbi:MAG: hypothetical protein ACO3QP_07635 [Burkholderiaceae bacterium]